MSDTALMLGDCLERMKEIPDGSVDMILTDPPYGTTACKWDSIIPLEPMWEQLKRIIKPNGAIVMTASQPFTAALVMSNPKLFRYDFVWEKPMATGALNANRMPLRAHESVLVFYEKLPTYNPQKTNGKPYRKVIKGEMVGRCYGGTGVADEFEQINCGTRHPRSVFKISNPNHKALHPTQKPVALMEYLIRTYTNEGETVLDFTMGSGTTGVACVNLNRNFIGIELDEGYFKIAEERIQKAKERQND
jgi:site-specific DNA-methyltransferase (adenine-specific)